MIKVKNNHEIIITDENEIDVEINFRCWISENPNLALYPMTVSSSIYKGETLQEFIGEMKKDYEKDYIKVEVAEVFVSELNLNNKD